MQATGYAPNISLRAHYICKLRAAAATDANLLELTRLPAPDFDRTNGNVEVSRERANQLSVCRALDRRSGNAYTQRAVMLAHNFISGSAWHNAHLKVKRSVSLCEINQAGFPLEFIWRVSAGAFPRQQPSAAR